MRFFEKYSIILVLRKCWSGDLLNFHPISHEKLNFLFFCELKFSSIKIYYAVGAAVLLKCVNRQCPYLHLKHFSKTHYMGVFN